MLYPNLEPTGPLRIAEPNRGSRWQQYIRLLSLYKVPEKAHRYCVEHVEDLIRETGQTPLLNLRRKVVEAFFQQRADNPRLEDWQVRQCVDAILITLPWRVINPFYRLSYGRPKSPGPWISDRPMNNWL